jgi:ActD protein
MSDDRYRRGELYGVLAAFETPEALSDAARKLWQHGYRRVAIYTPFPLTELNDLFRDRSARLRTVLVSPIVFLGGLAGALTAIVMQEYANVIDYPLNIGGRPHNSWPSFIPITFETTILGAALAAAVAFLILNSLPQFHHPLFNAPRFERASQDRFFICVEKRDGKYDEAAELLRKYSHAVEEVWR